jgi:hypothetical protein
MTAPSIPANAVFHRQDEAQRLAKLILHPSGASSASSGIFLAAPRRTGKTTFLRADLAPALEQVGALVLYVDLWADRRADPGDVIVSAIRIELARHDAILAKFSKAVGLKGGKVAGLEFSLDHIGLGKDVSLVQALASLSDEVKAPIVLMIDEAQQASTTACGNDALFSLKAARDELNSRHHGLRVVCTGSNRDKLSLLRVNKDQAFFGAPLVDFPPLGKPFIDRFCSQSNDLPAPLDPERVWPLFQRAGNRPEILGAAADQLRFDFVVQARDVAARFETVVREQIEQANDELLRAFHSLTPLQSAVLRVLAAMGKDYAPFEQATMERYRDLLGDGGEDAVTAQNVQAALASLQDKGLVWRASRGVYAMEDDGFAALLERKGFLG